MDQVTRTLWLAFREDPLWRWVFPEHHGLAVWWRFLIGSALKHGWVWILGDYAAASVWIPPGCAELELEEERQVEGHLEALVGARVREVMQLLERFEAAHPRTTPHYYLSLLGTHPDHRGSGLGMYLLTENLRLIDEQRMPAYLESSNPVNCPRYESVGFQRMDEFLTPTGEGAVTTMWRPSLASAKSQ